MSKATIKDFLPGTVVAVYDYIKVYAVVFDREAWAKLAQKEIRKETIENVQRDSKLIPLRILGNSTGPNEVEDFKEWLTSLEPSRTMVRHYIYSNVGGSIKIVDDPQALSEFLCMDWLHGNARSYEIATDLNRLLRYLKGNDVVDTDIKEEVIMRALLEKGIPRR